VSYFNLIDEPWIPVRDLNGHHTEVGIKEILTKAETFAEVEHQSPLVVAALYRFLLAVLYRALEGPTDIDQARIFFEEGFPTQKIVDYLEKWRDRFYLFDDKYPFGQIPGLEPPAKKGMGPWTELAAECSVGNNLALFDHSIDDKARKISPAEAIKYLLATQTFALGGGKSYFENIMRGYAPSATALMVLPLGLSLQETFSFCLVPQNKEISERDIPIWERIPDNPESLKTGPRRSPFGLADLYTWRSRSVLFPIVNYREIEKIAFTSGIGINEKIVDPMLAYRVKKKEGPLPIRFEKKGTWRDFDSLLPDAGNNAPRVIENALNLARRLPNRRPKSILVLGQSNSDARINFWRAERFVFPNATMENSCLRADIEELLKQSQSVSTVLSEAIERYYRYVISRKGQESDSKRGKESVRLRVESNSAMSLYWSLLEPVFHDLLAKIPDAGLTDELKYLWTSKLREALYQSWQRQNAAVNPGDVWSIRALAKANGIIKSQISKLEKREKLYLEVK
jgi:CRISPR system Cascade subunit CasA